MDLVTKSQVQTAVNQKFGKPVELKDYEVIDFIQKGDCYTSVVYRVKVTVDNDGETENSSMIVKVHPNLGMPETNEYYLRTFQKEGGFYLDLAPLLSTELSLIGHVSLRIPKAYYLHLEDHQETLYLEDLGTEHFEELYRTIPFDVSRTILVLQEFARLHGASMLLAKRSSDESLLAKFPMLKNLCAEDQLGLSMEKLFSGNIQGCIDCAMKTSGYEAVGVKLTQILPNLYKIMSDCQQTVSKFSGIIHLDCYTNNYLFRYTKSGSAEEVRLVDFQLVTIGSVISDVITTLHTCITGHDRRRHLDCYLYNYYATLSTVFASAGEPMPFSMEEMKAEYNRLKLYGLIFGVFSACVTMESDQIEDYNADSGESLYNFHRRQIVYSFDNNSTFQSRLMDIFNEFIQCNLV